MRVCLNLRKWRHALESTPFFLFPFRTSFVLLLKTEEALHHEAFSPSLLPVKTMFSHFNLNLYHLLVMWDERKTNLIGKACRHLSSLHVSVGSELIFSLEWRAATCWNSDIWCGIQGTVLVLILSSRVKCWICSVRELNRWAAHSKCKRLDIAATCFLTKRRFLRKCFLLALIKKKSVIWTKLSCSNADKKRYCLSNIWCNTL